MNILLYILHPFRDTFSISEEEVMDNELEELTQNLRSLGDFKARYSKVIRDARDYVIDTEKTGRAKLAEAEKAEKTIFGMKVEAYLRNEFNWPKGEKLDFYIGDIEFDSKATIGKNWMIPPEAFGELCLLTRIDESKAIYSAGLLRATSAALTVGQNQDKKRSISAAGKKSIRWLIFNQPYQDDTKS